MIGEYSIMDWVQLGGILAALATVWSLFRDNQSLKKQIDSLSKQIDVVSKQNGTPENAHVDLLKGQYQHHEELRDVFTAVGTIDSVIKEESFLRKQIQANDRTAYDAVLNLQTYLANTQDNREVQLAKAIELKRTIEKLEEEKGALQDELSQVKSRNLELSHENAKLKDGNNPKRGRGPVLRP